MCVCLKGGDCVIGFSINVLRAVVVSTVLGAVEEVGAIWKGCPSVGRFRAPLHACDAMT